MTDKEVIDTLRGLVDMESGVGMHTELVSLKPHQRIAIKDAVRMLEEVERLQAELDMRGEAWGNSVDIWLDERKRLTAENAAMREIVQAVADYPTIGNEQVTPQMRLLQLSEQARAILEK